MAESQIYEKNINNNEESNIWNLYLCAMKSPITKQKYQKRSEKFLDSKKSIAIYFRKGFILDMGDYLLRDV
ncbi:hypothetical protein BH23THE1_BH23THE1_28770 [soil metagenome]